MSDPHAHGMSSDADRRYLWTALVLLGAFMVGEVVVAFVAKSLVLLSDAGHMLSDVGAIAGALWAMRLAARPAAGVWTFGWKRAEIVSAALNGITLLVVSGIVTFEAVRRLIDPPNTRGGGVLAVAIVGVCVNLAATALLARANRSSLNIEGAFRHLVTDLYGFLGTLVAAIVIIAHGLHPGRRHRLAARRRPDGACGVGSAARLRPDPARGRPRVHRPRRDPRPSAP